MKIVIPDNNSIRFVKKQYNSQPSGSGFSNTEAPFHRNYFNTRYEQEIKDNINADIGLYKQAYGDLSNYVVQMYRGESLTIQYLADFEPAASLSVKAYDGSDTEISTISVANQLKIINTAFRTKYANVKIVDKGGFLAFYFTTGTRQYIGNLTTVIETDSYYLNGQLPTYMTVGQSIEWVGGISNPNEGTHTITSLAYDDTLGVMVAVTSTAYASTSTTIGTGITIHERLDLNVWEITISDLPLNECIYFRVNLITDFYPQVRVTILETWETDYIYIKQDIIDGVMHFAWSDPKDKYNTDFRTGLKPFCYLPTLLYDITPEIGGENYTNEQGYATLYGTNYKRKYEAVTMAIPRAFVEKLSLILTHKTVYINHKQFVFEIGSDSWERIEDSMLYTYKFTVYESELLGIYSLDYVNTTDDTEAAKLLIDSDDHMKIDGNGNVQKI